MNTKKAYQAYLLRIWREDEFSPWRASAQGVQGDNQRQFASLVALFDYLRRQTEGGELPGEQPVSQE